MYFYTRPECGAYLDPGERCDCKEKAALDAANIGGGMAEPGKTISDHIVSKSEGSVNL